MTQPSMNPYAPAVEEAPPPPRPAPPEQATTGQRIAGAVLIANAVLALVGAAVLPSTPSASELISPSISVAPAIVDLAIGASLLGGKRKLVPWATLRVGLGLVLFTALQLKDPVAAVAQVVVCGSMLLLLVGDAGKPRIAAGMSLFSLYALFAVVGYAGTVLHTNPLRPVLLVLSGDVEREPAHLITGVAYPYTLEVPGDHWRLRTAEAARKDQPLADRWLTRPDKDAHIMTIVEKVPGKVLYLDAYADAVLDAQKQASTRFELVDRGPLPGDPENGRFVHSKFTASGMDFERYAACVTTGGLGVQIIATVQRDRFAEMSAELRQIVESFRLPPEAWKPTEADVEQAPAGDVTGVAYPYTLRAASERWHLRKDAAAKADQPLADRWLVRPDRAAHMIVIAEHVPGAKMDVDKYTDTVLAGAKGRATTFEVVTRTPLASDPARGRFVHTRTTMSGTEFDYCYGLVTAGDRAFQVIGFAEHLGYPSVEGELRRMVESLRVP